MHGITSRSCSSSFQLDVHIAAGSCRRACRVSVPISRMLRPRSRESICGGWECQNKRCSVLGVDAPWAQDLVYSVFYQVFPFERTLAPLSKSSSVGNAAAAESVVASASAASWSSRFGKFNMAVVRAHAHAYADASFKIQDGACCCFGRIQNGGYCMH